MQKLAGVVVACNPMPGRQIAGISWASWIARLSRIGELQFSKGLGLNRVESN